MHFTQSLRKNTQFRTVYNRGQSIANRTLVMVVLKNGQDINRLGVTVSKKVGKSVIRSRVSRLIKESYRLTEPELKAGYDIVVIARVSAKDATYHQVESAIRHLLRKHRLMKGAQTEQ